MYVYISQAVEFGGHVPQMAAEAQQPEAHFSGDGGKPRTSADCALLYQQSDDTRVLGRQKVLGYPSNHRVEFCYSSMPNRIPFIGIRIYFPRAWGTTIYFYNTAVGQHSACSHLTIDVFLPLGTGTCTSEVASEEFLSTLPPRKDPLKGPLEILRMSVKDGAKPTICGLGMPFVARDAEDDRVVHHGAKLEGLVTLRELFDQPEFTVLLPSKLLDTKAMMDHFGPASRHPIPKVFPYNLGYVIIATLAERFTRC